MIRILAPLKAVGRVRGTTNESPSATNTRRVNVFASLGPEVDKALENDQVQQIKPGERVSEDSDIAEAAPVLDDDELGQWIELSIFIYVSQASNYYFTATVDAFEGTGYAAGMH